MCTPVIGECDSRMIQLPPVWSARWTFPKELMSRLLCVEVTMLAHCLAPRNLSHENGPLFAILRSPSPGPVHRVPAALDRIQNLTHQPPRLRSLPLLLVPLRIPSSRPYVRQSVQTVVVLARRKLLHLHRQHVVPVSDMQSAGSHQRIQG